MLAALLFTVSAVGAALAPTFTRFVIYRIIGGLAVGIAATVSPMYMSEVSPKDMRGRALSMQQFAIVFGQIVIFYVNFKIASLASEAPAGGNGLALDVRLGRDPLHSVLHHGIRHS